VHQHQLVPHDEDLIDFPGVAGNQVLGDEAAHPSPLTRMMAMVSDGDGW
jgi:hypothetical protein